MKARIAIGILSILAVIGTGSFADAKVTTLATSRAVEYDSLNNQYYAGYDQWSDSDQYSANPTADTAAGTGLQTQDQSVYIAGCQCINQIEWQAIASSAASASGGYGNLHARASAIYEFIPYTQTFEGFDKNGNPYSVTRFTPFYVRATGSASADFTDVFTVTSTTLNPGDTVSAKFSIAFDANLSGGTASARLYALRDYVDTTPGGSVQYTDTTDGGTSTTESSVATLTVGGTYWLHGYLDVRADVPNGACAPATNSIDDYGYTLYAPRGPECGHQSVTVDAGDTANFYIDPLGNDFTIAYDSGFEYASPSAPTDVPEPNPLALFGVGLAGLAMARRRRWDGWRS